MSDALNSDMNQSPSLDDSSQPVDTEQLNATPHTLDGGWETINFPGALDVDAIPMEAAVIQAHPLVRGEGEGSDEAALMCQLQQENEALHHQVAQLEADLSQLQIELQLEVARYYCKEVEATEPTQADDRATPVDPAQAQIQQLTQALASSQATKQQQQQQIESLTEQLNTSRQRIAQLERDCALSQQRYNEQLQLVSQAENTCQDLRMRLHRQQQQTLQFKAALEKSIEMNAVLETMQTEPIAPTAPETDHPPGDTGVAFIPKAKPVQPWSGASGTSPHLNISVKHPGTGLPELLSRLAKPPTPQPTAAVEPTPSEPDAAIPPPPLPAPETTVDESSKHILEFLFPAHATPRIADVPPPEAAVFDLSPFIEAGEVDAESLSHRQAEEPIATVIHHPTAALTPPLEGKVIKLERPQDQLWADLAQLIEPDLEPTEAASSQTAELSEPLPISTPAEVASEHHAFDREPAQSIDIAAFSRPQAAAREEAPVTTHNPFPSFTLQVSESQESITPIATVATDVSSAVVVTSFPSPVLYPARQPKKLASMAAVDLPSFPRG